MSEAVATVAGAAVAVLIAAGLTGLIAWSGPVDAPRDRGFHERPTPTSGGLAIMAGASVGLLAFALLAGPLGTDARRVALALGFAGIMGLIGALDDLLDLGAKAKLLIQIALALAFAVWVGRIEALPLGPGLVLPLGPIGGALGTALWIVVATNAVNFMDGSNGLAPGGTAIALAAFAAAAFAAGAPLLGGAALAGAAAGIGFLPWNLAGRLFQGDAGALFSSALLATLAVLGVNGRGGGAVFLYFAPLALLPYLTDVLLTLLWRARRGRSLLDAHRDHLYQLWLARTGRPHLALAWRSWLVIGASAGLALLDQNLPRSVQPAVFAAATAASALAWYVARRRLTPRP